MIERELLWIAVGIFAVAGLAAIVLPPLGALMGW